MIPSRELFTQKGQDLVSIRNLLRRPLSESKITNHPSKIEILEIKKKKIHVVLKDLCSEFSKVGILHVRPVEGHFGPLA